MIIIFIVYNYGSHYSNTRPPTPYKHSHPQLCVKNIRLALAVEYTTGNREKGGENYKIIFENHDVLPRPVQWCGYFYVVTALNSLVYFAQLFSVVIKSGFSFYPTQSREVKSVGWQ